MQIYNIENVYYNLLLTFLKKLIVFDIDFCELKNGRHELHEFPRIDFFSAKDLKD